MLDRLPSSLQHLVMLEWLSPTAVWTLARMGSTDLRKAVLTSPRAFRAAEGEVLSDACVHWYHRQQEETRGAQEGTTQQRPPMLVLWTTETMHLSGGVVHVANGQCHRDGDLPAAIMADGTHVWYRRGKIHRDHDRPAVVDVVGARETWYQNGKRHRDDGPAFVSNDGDYKEYWCHGVLTSASWRGIQVAVW